MEQECAWPPSPSARPQSAWPIWDSGCFVRVTRGAPRQNDMPSCLIPSSGSPPLAGPCPLSHSPAHGHPGMPSQTRHLARTPPYGLGSAWPSPVSCHSRPRLMGGCPSRCLASDHRTARPRPRPRLGAACLACGRPICVLAPLVYPTKTHCRVSVRVCRVSLPTSRTDPRHACAMPHPLTAGLTRAQDRTVPMPHLCSAVGVTD
ncbi:hypothetical protein CALCODRAFT_4382 [Calocera cornea HHB12733]|uniref:Uncharacterized protein n=1 Tax=Calocera cornea HHB12733 TaxID=1353952 RepID=A0A165KAZ1_9BASI|nr:hypothetical protein CALCODRAFT_4382 [Calocera cornea HHB12733]